MLAMSWLCPGTLPTRLLLGNSTACDTPKVLCCPLKCLILT